MPTSLQLSTWLLKSLSAASMTHNESWHLNFSDFSASPSIRD
jgi:hypothetical protein